VSDDLARHVSAGHEGAWAAINRQGYALTNDQLIGLPPKFRQNFSKAYFNPWTLHHDEGDYPVDRQRARDVLQYRWGGDDGPHLERHETITITDRAGIPGEREHTRVELSDDPQAKDLIRALLLLVPPSRRRPHGTFGVNLFRTFTNVVTKPHRDNEEFIILYVLDRIGGGAETYLYASAGTEDGQVTEPPVLRQQLNPGDIIIFEDKPFQHGASPLTNPPGQTARRDVLVCTVDNPSTYLAAAAN
jgi:hypothetical protein